MIPKLVPNPIDNVHNAFPVVLVGDALMSPEYRLGTGVINGTNLAKIMVNCIDVGVQVVINQAYQIYSQPIIANIKKQ